MWPAWLLQPLRPQGQCGWDGRAGTGPLSLHFLFNDQREGSHGPSSPWDLSEVVDPEFKDLVDLPSRKSLWNCIFCSQLIIRHVLFRILVAA